MFFLEKIKFGNKVYKVRDWVTSTLLLIQALGYTAIAYSLLWLFGFFGYIL